MAVMKDAVLNWNAIALEANRISHSNGMMENDGPPRSARALALVHLAMYDAYTCAAQASGMATAHGPYLDGGVLHDAPAGASPRTAVAGAAYQALSKLFPSQTGFFDLFYDETTAPIGVGEDSAKDGYAYGRSVADLLLMLRNGDQGASVLDYKPTLGRGKHRPDPDNPMQSFHGPKYGNTPLFACTERFDLAAPPDPDVTAGEYRRALRQVRAKGISQELLGTIPAAKQRTPNETVIGLYWAYDGANGLGTPPRLYNQIIREVAMNVANPTGAINTIAENARLFALVNAAMADAGVLSWEIKYRDELWRPVLGVREHHDSIGMDSMEPSDDIGKDGDPAWLPLGAPYTNVIGKNFTPPFPAYPSGHATFGAAAFHIARRFYGIDADDRQADNLFDDLSFTSEELNGISRDNKGVIRPSVRREFPGGLWQMIVENGLSRVYLGVHWSFDAFALKNTGNDDDMEPDIDKQVDGLFVGGVPLGIQIANDIFDVSQLQASLAGGPPMTLLAEAAAPEAVETALSAEAPRLPWPLG